MTSFMWMTSFTPTWNITCVKTGVAKLMDEHWIVDCAYTYPVLLVLLFCAI